MMLAHAFLSFVSPLAPLPLEGIPKARFTATKARFQLGKLTQIHHIIPRQHHRHPAVRWAGYDIEDGANFMLLPNRQGAAALRTTRPVHEGGHAEYNAYVHKRLDQICNEGGSPHLAVRALARELRWRVAHDAALPWRSGGPPPPRLASSTAER